MEIPQSQKYASGATTNSAIGSLCGIVAAGGVNFLIGWNSKQEWLQVFHLPWKHHAEMQDDMAFFRNRTRGAHVVMGRKTLQNIGRLLPGRVNLIFSGEAELRLGSQVLRQYSHLAKSEREPFPPGVLLRGWEELENLSIAGKIFLLGGAEMFAAAWQRGLLKEFYLTYVDKNDFSPPNCEHEWQPVYLPQNLRQVLQEMMPEAKPIEEIVQEPERNLYSAKIYHFQFRDAIASGKPSSCINQKT